MAADVPVNDRATEVSVTTDTGIVDNADAGYVETPGQWADGTLFVR